MKNFTNNDNCDNFMVSLPKDLVVVLLSEWIETYHLSLLDCALCNKKTRVCFTNTLKQNYVFSCGIDKTMGYKYLMWLFFRELKVTQLNLTNLSGADMFLLSDTLDQLLKLKSFKLHNCMGKCDGILQKLSMNSECLKSLVMDSCDDLSEGCIIEALKKLSLLTSIALISCLNITSSTTFMLQLSCPSITQINLSHSTLTTESALHLAKAYHRNLRHFDISCIKSINSVTVIQIAETCTSLELLNISHCFNITDAAVIRIAECNSGLTSLGVAGASLLTNASLSVVASHCKFLVSLDLSGCTLLSDSSVITLAKNCFNLQSFKLEDCTRITDTAIIAIAECCDELQELNLTYCHSVSDAAIMGLTKCCGQSLNTIVLKYCYKLTDVSLYALAENCPFLSTLSVSNCERLTDGGVIHLAEMLCDSLTSVDISGCTALSDASVMGIAVCCGGMLKALNCSDNLHITDDCVSNIMSHCVRLRSLDISYCPGVSRECIEEVAGKFPRLELHAMIYRTSIC